ncbi:MAG: DUF1254 domain-containing protein [Candidatus Kaistia colombiensis]|nr:MAG: DUF1254 domain-containing protein [Kaistia sp.]
MRTKIVCRTVAAVLFCGVSGLSVSAQERAASPLVQQINNGNWLPQAEAEQLVDDLYFNQAIQAYITLLPALNIIGIRDGSEATFGKGYNVLPIWKERMDSRTWIPTPNADVIYSMSYLDLKETGPLVVAAPPNVIGMFTDFFQNTITDVGAIGPDRARGGLYLLLPPDYAGEVPQGYFAFRSKTYNVFLFFRTVMKQGEKGPDPAPAVALAETTRVYPLWEMEKDVKPMQFPDGSGKGINMMYPTDNTFWTKLKAFVDYEPAEAIDPLTRGVLAKFGIVKGKPFAPTERQQALLKKAVETAPKMILATRQLGRPDKRNLYYTDRQCSGDGGETKWVVPEKFFEEFGEVLASVDPLPGEEALYAQFRLLLDSAAKDPSMQEHPGRYGHRDGGGGHQAVLRMAAQRTTGWQWLEPLHQQCPVRHRLL